MNINFIGDWGLGIGDWGLGIGPNPQSPIPIIQFLLLFLTLSQYKIILYNIIKKDFCK